MASTSPEEHLANASATTSVDTAATPSPSSPPPPPSGKGKKQGSVADRVAWLQSGRAFAKDADSPSKRDLGLESSTSVSDRKRWMEEGAFRKHLEDRGYVADGSDVSGASLVEERRRWLHEQAERNRLENERNQINKAGGSPRGANTNAAMNKSEANKAEEEDKAETEDSAEPPVLVEEEEEEEEEVGGAGAGTPWYSNDDCLWSSSLCRSSKLIAHFPTHLAWPRLSKEKSPWMGKELITRKFTKWRVRSEERRTN